MNGSTNAWAPYAPTDTAPWNLQRIVHLHRRAGFAAPWSLLQRDLQEGPDAAIERLLSGEAPAGSDFESVAHTIGDAAVASDNPDRLKAWWLYRMLLTPDPLGERLTLMWHNHFATSNRKVQNLVQMRAQSELFRRHARGTFADLLRAVVKHPAMLIWLDADSNRKDHPNENLARELLELFTLGIGNYSEQDIREAARALSGWQVVRNGFHFSEPQHDSGEKLVLGRQGRFTGDDLLKLLVEHPSTARRLAWRLCETFMGENVVEATAMNELADGLTNHNLDIEWGVATILRSERFFAEENISSRVLGPVEFVVGAVRALELLAPPPSTLTLADYVARSGQDLFYPPNVGGWPAGRAWLSSRAIVARANFATALAHGRLWSRPQPPDIHRLLGADSRTSRLEDQVGQLVRLLYGKTDNALLKEIVAQARAEEIPVSTAVALLLARPGYHLA